jgi:hypothetical protein
LGALSVAPATDQSSSAVALQLVSENGELADEAETLTPEELEKAKQIAVETFAQQMLLKAAENSSVEIVQVILDQYKDNADLQNALIMMLQSYKVVTADAWWSDYWIDHENRTVYVSSKNNYYTRDAASIVGELSEAIRDDSQFYQMFGLDESWEGFSSRIGFGLLEAGGGALSVVGGALLIVAPEPTMLTKAGGGMAVTFGANSVVAGVSSLAGRESRVDVIGSGLEKYYDATGVDQDLRAWGHGALLVSNVASGFSGVKSSWGTIKSLLTNSKAFVQQSLTKFQELLHSGKSIREIAKIDDMKALVFASETTALASRSSSSWDDLLGSVGKYQFRSVSDLTKWEMISAELRTLIPQLKLIVGKGEYTFSGDILRARQVLADLTAVTGKEVALLILPGGRQIIRVGTSSSRVSAKGATEIVAHTHPNGFLMLSDDAAKAAAADTKQLAARGQYQTYLVGPAGDLVKWQSPSETWFDDMVGTIIRGGN